MVASEFRSSCGGLHVAPAGTLVAVGQVAVGPVTLRKDRKRRILGMILLTACLAAGLILRLPAQHPPREPVLAGDHPDPSVILVGGRYWATSTSGGWAPIFPLFRSGATDKTWRQTGSIFAAPPTWAKGDFWAPELVDDRGHIRVYYTARDQEGVLCVAVATASVPQGPYTDHGPLVCQPDGSIDASFIRNSDGLPYLIWKEDGNSRRQPTTIWAQGLSEDGLTLRGQPTQLLGNDAPWEGGVVEAPYILRRDGWFYLFYAGNACCGLACHYAEGVARSRSVLGPWEKDPANPIIHDGNGWLCPGHGTAVETSGVPRSSWFLLHAYSKAGGVYVARQAVRVDFAWRAGWPTIADSEVPPANHAPAAFADNFSGALEPGWQWVLAHRPELHIGAGALSIATTAASPTVEVARLIDAPAYTASVLLRRAPDGPNAFTGLGVVGNHHALAIGWQQDHIVLWADTAGAGSVFARGDHIAKLPIELRVEATEPQHPAFSWREPGGPWRPLRSDLTSDTLVSWDSGLRLGMIVTAPTPATATFARFRQQGIAPNE